MKNQRGLTLIELMVTLAVAIVLLAIGIPAFNTLTARDISAATVNATVTALQQARMEAITRSETIGVCPLACDGGQPDCAATDWNCGWAVVRDLADIDPEDILRVFSEPRGQMDVAASGLGGTAPWPIRFTSRGELPAAPETSGTATVAVDVYPSADHSDEGEIIRAVEIYVNRIGQVRSEIIR